MSAYKLRPHHGLCMAFFEGKGYSKTFVENMTKVLSAFEEADPEVMLICAGDVLCRCCPHDRAGCCESAEKVGRYDASVLRQCGLQEGDVLHYLAFRALAAEQIIAAGRLGEVCGDCQWFSICQAKAPQAPVLKK